MKIFSPEKHVEIATPSTPSSGVRSLYAKSDGFYEIDSSGVETKLTNVAAGGGGDTYPKEVFNIKSQTFTANADITLTHNLGISQAEVEAGDYAVTYHGFATADALVYRAGMFSESGVDNASTRHRWLQGFAPPVASVYWDVNTVRFKVFSNRTLINGTFRIYQMHDSSGNVQ